MKKALITGISGQDGAYLAKHLLEHDYMVYGGLRRGAERSLWRLDYLKIKEKITIVELEMCEFSNLHRVLVEVRPDNFSTWRPSRLLKLVCYAPLYHRR